MAQIGLDPEQMSAVQKLMSVRRPEHPEHHLEARRPAEVGLVGRPRLEEVPGRMGRHLQGAADQDRRGARAGGPGDRPERGPTAAGIGRLIPVPPSPPTARRRPDPACASCTGSRSPSRPFVDVVVEVSPRRHHRRPGRRAPRDTSTATPSDRSRSRLRTTPRCRVETRPWPPRHPGREVSSPSCRRPRSSAPVRSPPRWSCRQPLVGHRRRLPYGRSTLGSAPTCAVVVGAAGVAPVHAEVVVGDGVDCTPSDGELDVDGTPVRGGHQVGIRLAHLDRLRAPDPADRPAPPAAARSRPVASRGSRAGDASRAGRSTLEVPVPPERTRPPGFPVLSATVPLLMGAALWVATRERAHRGLRAVQLRLRRRRRARVSSRVQGRAALPRRGVPPTARRGGRPGERRADTFRRRPRRDVSPSVRVARVGWPTGTPVVGTVGRRPGVMRVRLGHREQCRRAVRTSPGVDPPISGTRPTGSSPTAARRVAPGDDRPRS